MAKDLDYYLAQARRIAEHREAGAEKEIRKLYKAMLKDLQQFMSETYIQYAEDDKLTYAMLQKAGYDARFLDEIEQRLNISTPAAAKQLRELVEETYTAAYEGMVRGVQKVAQGAVLEEVFAEFVAITPEQIRAAVENPISGLTLNDILEKNRKDITYSIKQTVGVGLMNGDRYTTIARRIADQLDGDYKKAVRIARTECNRAREAGNHDAATDVDEALKRGTTGLRFVKVWKTMQDERVRPQRRRKGKKGWNTTMGLGANHMQLNGQTVLEDEPFDLGDGVTAMAPGQSGVAGHDVNCRCYVSRSMMTDAEFFKATGRHFPEKTVDKITGYDILKEIELREIPITDKAIENVPLACPSQWTKEQASQLREAHKELLRMVKDEPVGTEAYAIYDLQMKLISQDIGEKGQVRIPDFLEPHIAIHNHPDGLTFSGSDVERFIERSDLQILTAIGNDGSVYLLEKTDDYAAVDFIRSYLGITERYPQMMNSPTEYVKAMNEFLKEGAEYGVEYYEVRP